MNFRQARAGRCVPCIAVVRWRRQRRRRRDRDAICLKPTLNVIRSIVDNAYQRSTVDSVISIITKISKILYCLLLAIYWHSFVAGVPFTSPFSVVFMFHKPEDLLKRTPADGINRPEFLKQLVQEFRKTNNTDSKRQVLANLANFAYDPINFPHVRALKIIDLFIEQLLADDEKLIAFAAAGLCNLANDPANKNYIIGNGGIQNIERNLNVVDDSIILSCITTLMYLYAPEIKTDIINPSIVGCILTHARSENPRLRNVANIFLTDFCTEQDIQNTIASNTS